MRILCVFAKHPVSGDANITKDLSDSLHELGHEVCVVTLSEKKFAKSTQNKNEDGYSVLRVRTGNMFDTVTKYEKFVSALRLPRQLYAGIKRYFGDKKFDLIIAHTPFVANASMIKKLKKLYWCPALLILWDIFPQNAVDLGMLNKGVLHALLKRAEKRMLKIFDYISCMSEGNKNYLLQHYDCLDKEKLVVNYNWSKIAPKIDVDKKDVRARYGYTEHDRVAVFGGNIGKPQAIENVVYLAKKLPGVKFLFIGKGTELDRLKGESSGLLNVQILDFIARSDYEKLIAACDIGLVSLDSRFTVPNFPSKTTDYLKCGLPVFALLDSVSAEDYGNFLAHNHIGRFILASNIESDYVQLEQMFSCLDEYKAYPYKFFVNNLDVNQVANNFVHLFG